MHFKCVNNTHKSRFRIEANEMYKDNKKKNRENRADISFCFVGLIYIDFVTI